MHTLAMPLIPDEEETRSHFEKATTNFQSASEEKKSDESRKVPDEMMFEMFSSFLTRIAKLDELVDAAYRFLVGFQQALEFIKRPSIDMSHVVLEHVITANSTRQLSSYIEAGCFSTCDIKEKISKLHTCHLGLLDHKAKAKNVVKELESILDNAEEVVRAGLEDLHPLQDNDVDLLSSRLSLSRKEKVPPYVHQKPEVSDCAILMTSVFWMVKKDYKMQEKVVSALSLKSSSEELESYCLMWSLRPFVDNEIIEKAWRYVR